MKRKVSLIVSIVIIVSLLLFPSAGFAEETELTAPAENEMTAQNDDVHDATGIVPSENSLSVTADTENVTDDNSTPEDNANSEAQLSADCVRKKLDEGVCGEYLEYVLYEDGVLEISGTGDMYDYKFGKAPWYAENRNNIKTVIIKDGVTGIGKCAFHNCKALEKVNMAGSVDRIGDNAFYICTKLTEVNFGSGVETIGKSAFYCTGIRKTVFPQSLRKIGDGAFDGCSNLEFTALPAMLESIGRNAFLGCTHIESIIIPAGVKEISTGAFSGCIRLDSVKLGINVASIGEYAFKDCTDLESFTVTSAVTTVKDNAFTGCENLEKITFAGDCPSFGAEALSGLSADAYYYCTKNGWSKDTLKDYGGDIDWHMVHGYVVHYAAKAATCERDGNTEFWVCSVCRRYYSDKDCSTEIEKGSQIIKSSGHIYSKKWSSNLVGHWHECTCCGDKTEYALHTAVVDKAVEATEGHTGLTAGLHCSVCGKVIVAQEVIPALKTLVPLYRLYNPRTGEHLYTESETERDTLSAGEWNYEGVHAMVPTSGDYPMYRMYNPNSGDHHYTGSMVEVDNLVNAGWKYEGIAFYSAGTTPVYRMYNPNAVTGIHHYTASIEERDYLVSVGWRYEGVGWYQL